LTSNQPIESYKFFLFFSKFRRMVMAPFEFYQYRSQTSCFIKPAETKPTKVQLLLISRTKPPPESPFDKNR
jgi:hypothetical protein